MITGNNILRVINLYILQINFNICVNDSRLPKLNILLCLIVF